MKLEICMTLKLQIVVFCAVTSFFLFVFYKVVSICVQRTMAGYITNYIFKQFGRK
jgi:hypothetical protein